MREESRRKLQRVLWRQRAEKAIIPLGVLAVVALLGVFMDYDRRAEITHLPGTVLSVGPSSVSNSGRVGNSLSVYVALSNGRHVNVTALKSANPHVGDHVRIIESRHHTGRITYSWE